MLVAFLMTLYAGIVPLADSPAQSTDTYSSPTQVVAAQVSVINDITNPLGDSDITNPAPGKDDITNPNKPRPSPHRDADITNPAPKGDDITNPTKTEADITNP
ncbi:MULTISPECIES: hypothetical protein [unclassified Crossiella]|uniref:hypothetical protein n=1 Tax=unclassified Crossiella TaxID=2620835 RepID=UPI001FFF9B14|nr:MULTISPECIES: hypothetical protein [unclassified Crossiella]MCK2243340.1 hypothetical protein [Crossiella sp. S99.2]MCK2254191.1 hypothetical protein [Crossiella sp. S99.1]